jgi:hypothetical protein
MLAEGYANFRTYASSVEVSMAEEAVILPGLKNRPNPWKLLLKELSFYWESASLSIRLLHSEVGDGVSDNEAAEISSQRLLR